MAPVNASVDVLDLTEKIVKDPKRDREKLSDSIVMSDTNLVAWRLVIQSSVGLMNFCPMVTFLFDWEIQSRPNRSNYIFYLFTRCSNNNNI